MFHLYVYVYAPHAYLVPKEDKEATRSLGTGARDGCEPPMLGIKSLSSARAVSALIYWLISAALKM